MNNDSMKPIRIRVSYQRLFDRWLMLGNVSGEGDWSTLMCGKFARDHFPAFTEGILTITQVPNHSQATVVIVRDKTGYMGWKDPDEYDPYDYDIDNYSDLYSSAEVFIDKHNFFTTDPEDGWSAIYLHLSVEKIDTETETETNTTK